VSKPQGGDPHRELRRSGTARGPRLEIAVRPEILMCSERRCASIPGPAA
jgi:hypothetical protein